MYINIVMLYGNLTRDPELRALPAGGAVCSFSIATNRSYKKPDGTKTETTEFHSIVVFGRQAESCHQYLHTGDAAFIQGRLQTRSWEKDDTMQYKTEIVAEGVQFAPKARSAAAKQTTEHDPRPQSMDRIEYPVEDINPDDIPF